MHASAPRDPKVAPDLAEFVLADARAHGRTVDRAAPRTGHDPRSVLVLAIVVATLSMVIAWTATLGGGGAATLPKESSTAPTPAATDAAPEPAAAAADGADAADTPAPIIGSDLQIGRVITEVTADRLSLVRVAVENGGTKRVAAGGQLLVLLDGEQVGSAPVGAIGASSEPLLVDVPLYRCISGRHALVVIADGAGTVREADEGNNARSINAKFSCS